MKFAVIVGKSGEIISFKVRKFLVMYKIINVLFNSVNCIFSWLQVCIVIEKIIPEVTCILIQQVYKLP